ncbi:hypothetical protein GCM10018954_016040 [Kutzneria kofuensis]
MTIVARENVYTPGRGQSLTPRVGTREAVRRAPPRGLVGLNDTAAVSRRAHACRDRHQVIHREGGAPAASAIPGAASRAACLEIGAAIDPLLAVHVSECRSYL